MAEKKECKHTRWAYSTSLEGNAVATWIERICRGCGRTEHVQLGALPGEDYRAVWKKFHGGGK